MIIVNLDVLARPGAEMGARLPDPDGMRLWRMLYEQTMGRLAVVVDEPVNVEILEHWLKVNGVKAAVYQVLDCENTQDKADKIHILSMSVGRSDWYIDTDPAVCAITVALGIPTMLIAVPYVVRPEWVGTKVARSWDALVTEVDRQQTMKANKTWGDGPRRGDE